jgi:death-on-curing protein
MTIRYLTQTELIEINKYAVQQVGGITFGVQSKAALQVIVNQPQQVVFGHELYPTIWLKAAFILQKITKKHVFIDGNKRTAIQSALYFLMINGHQVKDDRVVNSADQFMLSVTNSPDSEDTMLMVAKWLAMVCE